jgi:hypothetical protein
MLFYLDHKVVVVSFLAACIVFTWNTLSMKHDCTIRRLLFVLLVGRDDDESTASVIPPWEELAPGWSQGTLRPFKRKTLTQMPYVPAYDSFHGVEHNIDTPVHNSIHKSSPLDRTILYLPHFFTIYFIKFNFNSRLIMLSTPRSTEWSYQYSYFQSLLYRLHFLFTHVCFTPKSSAFPGVDCVFWRF